MRRAPISLGITGAVAVMLVGSMAVASMAAVRAPARGASSVAVTSAARVKIVDLAFRPKTITIAKGTRLKWTNRGAVSHTTTSNKGLWNSGVLAPGDSFSRVFKRAGTFKYHCTIHSTMRGKIVVS
jgi:plastocyanin